MKKIKGRVALITGAAGGLGSAIAHELLAAGVKVAFADIAESSFPPIDQDNQTIARIPLDVSEPSQWELAFDAAEKALGPVSILVNNAGLGQFGLIAEESTERWRRTFEVNAFGPFYGCRAALSRMLDRGPGHIVIVASESGMQGSPGLAAYTASKHAAVGLARSLRMELIDKEVGVSLICPGMVQTNLVANSMDRIAADTNSDIPNADERALALTALEQGMDPAKVAARIVNAIRKDEFYVFTHPDFATTLKEQQAEMLTAATISADPDYCAPDLSVFRAQADANER